MRERRKSSCLSLMVCLFASLSPFSRASESTSMELDELREQVRDQRRQIETLQSELERQKRELEKVLRLLGAQAERGSAEAETRPAELEPPPSKIDTPKAEPTRAADTKIGRPGSIQFGGDIRLRYEPTFQGGAEDRHRGRLRARFHMTGRLSDEFGGGISLATGNLDDPVSPNQTFTGFFARKNFALDKAWITYRPARAGFLKLDAGKFEYPWYRTSLTFDSDMNPEGFAETMSFDLKSSVLKNITVVAFQLPFNEASTGRDSFVLGGQMQTHLRINSKARLSLYGAGIDIRRADPIAVASASGALRRGAVHSNTYRYGGDGTVAGFANRFAYLDTIVKLEMDTHPRFPTAIQFNFVNNVRGPRERSAYRADLTVGRRLEAGDIRLGYSFMRIEKDAVIGAWNESEMRSPTNLRSHRLSAAWMLTPRVSAELTAWIGRLANPWDNVELVPRGVRGACFGSASSACRDPYMKRLQLDLTYHF